MKKLLASLMALTMAASMVACGGNASSTSPASTDSTFSTADSAPPKPRMLRAILKSS